MKIILIGSSPAMMLQALVLSRKYNDIEIHEKKKRSRRFLEIIRLL